MLARSRRLLPPSWRALRPFSSSTDHVLCEDKGPVRSLTLNQPQKRNPLSLATLTALSGHLQSLPPEIGVVVIKARGPAFSAGHDLKEFSVATGRNIEAFREVLLACCTAMLQVAACPVPTIASVHGAAAAAGCQLVASCDLAVAAAGAKFSTPGISIGLFCSTPAVPVVRAVNSPKAAAHLLYTGDFIPADEALRIGLVGQVVPDEQLEAATEKLAAHIVRHSRPAIRLGKKALLEQTGRLQELEKAYRVATEAMLENLRLRDTQGGIDTFLKKGKQVWSHSEAKVL